MVKPRLLVSVCLSSLACPRSTPPFFFEHPLSPLLNELPSRFSGAGMPLGVSAEGSAEGSAVPLDGGHSAKGGSQRAKRRRTKGVVPEGPGRAAAVTAGAASDPPVADDAAAMDAECSAAPSVVAAAPEPEGQAGPSAKRTASASRRAISLRELHSLTGAAEPSSATRVRGRAAQAEAPQPPMRSASSRRGAVAAAAPAGTRPTARNRPERQASPGRSRPGLFGAQYRNFPLPVRVCPWRNRLVCQPCDVAFPVPRVGYSPSPLVCHSLSQEDGHIHGVRVHDPAPSKMSTDDHFKARTQQSGTQSAPATAHGEGVRHDFSAAAPPSLDVEALLSWPA